MSDVAHTENGLTQVQNPFDRQDGVWAVLVNGEAQYSLWPMKFNVPAGWTEVVRGTRSDCLGWVNNNWQEMRPQSLVKAMSARDRES